MEINNQNITSYHPVNSQAALRSDSQMQDRGPDSIPPTTASNSGTGTQTDYDNAKSSGRHLDVEA
ncbi:MAG: hypothetical protein JJT78_07350 [Leptospira sp.]|nr:hypothetical protein [Leptospira sp.]